MATRKKYQLEGMVKDSTVAAALSRALDGDGKLSYDELLVIIYSACDGNSITGQEVKDIQAILDNARSIASDPKIEDLKRRFKANPQSFLKYRNFLPSQLFTIVQDVQDASRLSQRCMNALVARPVPNDALETLIRRTFNISLQDRSEVSSIQQRFQRCWQMLGESTFLYDKEGTMIESGHVATASHEGGMQRLVYISSVNYFNRDRLYRQAVLIHEMIHHFNGYRTDAHPGGVKPGGKLPLSITFRQAVENPYCYQWFAVYHEQPNYTPSMTLENETIIRAK